MIFFLHPFLQKKLPEIQIDFFEKRIFSVSQFVFSFLDTSIFVFTLFCRSQPLLLALLTSIQSNLNSLFET